MSKIDSSYHYPIWDIAVGKTPWIALDPMVEDYPVLTKSTPFAALGCCFVQRMSSYLRANGFNFYVGEPGVKEAGVLSARYGNINSPRQALQLIRRAYGEMNDLPDAATVWKLREKGLYVDAYRPGFAESFGSVRLVKEERERHLAGVRDVFENAEIFLYTCGLIESWCSISTGIAYPTAPGPGNRDVQTGDMELKRFTVYETAADLGEFIVRLRKVNPKAIVILTLSPHSMIATFTPSQHVLLANCYGKSVLRAAFEEVCEKHAAVYYFPAYEMFATNYTAGILYERNMREVTPAGINFVMRHFLKHFSPCSGKTAELTFRHVQFDDVVCDPELLGEK